MTLHTDIKADPEASGANDEPHAAKFDPGFGSGGVPILLLLFYLSFLGFFTWYVLEYQLPDFLEHGPAQQDSGVVEPGADAAK